MENDDLKVLEDYFHKWNWQPNSAKTEAALFYLNNRLTNIVRIKNIKFPKYLGNRPAGSFINL